MARRKEARNRGHPLFFSGTFACVLISSIFHCDTSAKARRLPGPPEVSYQGQVGPPFLNARPRIRIILLGAFRTAAEAPNPAVQLPREPSLHARPGVQQASMSRRVIHAAAKGASRNTPTWPPVTSRPPTLRRATEVRWGAIMLSNSIYSHQIRIHDPHAAPAAARCSVTPAPSC
ncbi:hypothetical protein MRX96_010652 [Rhipicephalus microplus]